MIIQNSLGLSFEFLENGSIKSIEVDPIRISLKTTTPYSKYGANIYIRKRANPFKYTPIIGPESNSQFRLGDDGYIAKGNWEGLYYQCYLTLSKKSLSWQWNVEIRNNSSEDVDLDLIYFQDVGLKPINSGLVNEYYVSQYLERITLVDKDYGNVVCCRQNMRESVGNPWLMLVCKNGAVAANTDGMLFYGKSFRATGIPEGLNTDKLGGEYAGESSVIALQEKPFKIVAGEIHKSVFIGNYLQNHSLATSSDDLTKLSDLLSEFDNDTPSSFKNGWINPIKNLFNIGPLLHADDLSDKELSQFFGDDKRHVELENGKLLSFFYGENKHVMLRAKELITDRPHGHILQAKTGLIPDENIVSTTAFACGVFNSHITQGNTNFNILLSIFTSQFNQSLETGQRIFVEVDDHKYLLGVPSAFEMGLNYCRWIYKFGNHCFQIRTWASKSTPQINLDFKVLSGGYVNLLITHLFDESNGWTIVPNATVDEYVFKPKPSSMIAAKFPNAQFRILVQDNHNNYRACGEEILYTDNSSHEGSMFIFDIRKTSSFCMSFIGEVRNTTNAITIDNVDDQWNLDCLDSQSTWQNLSLNLSLKGDHQDIAVIREILPWYGMNALTHFLTPYGLEQFSGAAWGTRDVSQGPIDLLLSLNKYDEAKKIVFTIFSNQNPDGGWSQWWMFDSYSSIRAHDAHGDIVYWCIIALSNYIKITGDLKILNEVLPYYSENGIANAEKTPLSEHIDRLTKMIVDSFIPGTALVPYGGGDWNDSLQPVTKDLAHRMISSWTVEMNYQAFNLYSKVYELIGEAKKAKSLQSICDEIKRDFNKHLVKDGVVAGYGLVEKDGSINVLLHPSDTKTGIHYSILPMNRGIISGIFSNEQAEQHQKLIEQHLKGPDGARLMDRPLKYKGGVQTFFQRAESSTFFGREIGLMYTHEHIRYAESLAIMGKTDAFIKALRQAIPVDYREIVPCGDIRQSNCYYSSSDAVFKSRYEADELYHDIRKGKITLRGGWRVYSSGPGIYIGLVISRLLGLRVEFGKIIIDPIVPLSFDNFYASLYFIGYPITLFYKVKSRGFGSDSVFINGKEIEFERENNIYRKGGVIIEKNQFIALLNTETNVIEVHL